MGAQLTRDDQDESVVTLLTSSEFKAASAAPGADLAHLGVWKSSTDARKGILADGTIDFAISDEGQDRDGDTISLAGWRLDNFLKNPVVLFAHQHDELPVGKSISLRREGGSLVSRVEFTPHDLNPLGDTLRRMYAGGFMNAQSVGFQPRTWQERAASDDGMAGGWDFSDQELLEHSCVPVPSLPTALMRAHEAKINTAPLREWCLKMLDGNMPKGLAREDLERAWQVRTSKPLILEVRHPDPPAEAITDPEPETALIDPEVAEAVSDPAPDVAVETPQMDAIVAEVMKRMAAATPPSAEERVEAATVRLRAALRDAREAIAAVEDAVGGDPIEDPTADDYTDAYGDDLLALTDEDLRDLTLEALAEQGPGDSAPADEPH